MKKFLYLSTLFLSAVLSAHAITVYAPQSGASVTSPFVVSASTKTCGGVPVATMGYSIDSGSTVVEVSPFTASVAASVGKHTVHIKCWGTGASGDVDVAITVAPGTPANADSTTQIQSLSGWRIKHDPGTGGTASGAMLHASHPTLSGNAEQFTTSYSDWGGVLYSDTYGNDPDATNFMYDAEVWIASGSVIANLEMDNNQVVANGDTIIYAFQCAGTSGTWDYSENAGTPQKPVVRWVQSNQPCDPATWSKNTWHHVQIWTSRDGSGNVTYHSVWLDGVEYPVNKTVNSDFSLGWAAGILVSNFQVDDTSSNNVSSTLYVDDLTIYRW